MQSALSDVLKEVDLAIRQIRPASPALEFSTSIVGDLGLDSVEVMDFVMTLEDRFDISIPLDKIAEVETVQDLCTAIASLKKTDAA